MYVREKPCVFARNCLASKQGPRQLQLPRPGARAALRAAACLGQDRFIRPTLRYIQSCALLARRCLGAATPAASRVCGSCVARAWQPALAASARRRKRSGARSARPCARRESPPGADSVLGGGETAAEQLETGLQRLQYTDQLHCDEVEALVCGRARNTLHLHRTRWKTLIAFVTRQNHHH